MKSDRGLSKQSFSPSPQVPSLNDVPLHYLKPNSLVKFRCLIQDMFDPEFYMAAYETVDPNTKAKVGHRCCFAPCPVCLPVPSRVVTSSCRALCLFPGAAEWEVQRCDRMRGRFISP